MDGMLTCVPPPADSKIDGVSPWIPQIPRRLGLDSFEEQRAKKMKKNVVKNATDQRCEKSLRRDAPPDSNQSPSPLQIPICLA